MNIKKAPGGQRKPPEEHKVMTSIRLSPDAIVILGDLKATLGIRRTAIIELAIRQLQQHYRNMIDEAEQSKRESFIGGWREVVSQR